MRRVPFALFAGLILLTGCATAVATAPDFTPKQEAALAQALKGKVAGEPINCIDVDRARNSTAISDRILLYRESGRLVYRVETRGRCPGLERDDIIVSDIFGGRQCTGDLIRTVDRVSGFTSGSCIIDTITPYRAPRD